jgi:hypothetical protein
LRDSTAVETAISNHGSATKIISFIGEKKITPQDNDLAFSTWATYSLDN